MSEETWSVVSLGRNDGYAAEVWTFDTKSAAVEFAKETGDVHVVKGTQMWNEPLGQIEESDRCSTFVRYYRGDR